MKSIALAFLLGSGVLLAQDAPATITGIVADDQAVVSGATIQAKNMATGVV